MTQADTDRVRVPTSASAVPLTPASTGRSVLRPNRLSQNCSGQEKRRSLAKAGRESLVQRLGAHSWDGATGSS